MKLDFSSTKNVLFNAARKDRQNSDQECGCLIKRFNPGLLGYVINTHCDEYDKGPDFCLRIKKPVEFETKNIAQHLALMKSAIH